MSDRRASRDVDKRLSILSEAWLRYLPHSEPPHVRRVETWLRGASVERIAELIEAAGQRPHLHNPAGWVAACIHTGAYPMRERDV